MDRAAALWIASWRYDPPYDVYNTDPARVEEDVAYFLDPANGYFKIVDAAGNLLGFASFGPDGQVPGGDYGAEALDLGIGLAPELTGRGLGPGIVQAMLAFARERFGPVPAFRTTIARFNKRSRRVCEKLGFTVRQHFTAGGIGSALLVAGFAVAAIIGGRFLLETFDVQEQNRRAAEAFLSRAGTESGTPAAFLTVLRVNDHRAYSLTSPHLHYKIDEWLLTHEPGPLCRWRDDGGEIYTTTGFADRLTVRFQCVTTEGTGYIFEVRGLRIAETPWGAIQIIGWTGINETEVPVLSESVTR